LFGERVKLLEERLEEAKASHFSGPRFELEPSAHYPTGSRRGGPALAEAPRLVTEPFQQELAALRREREPLNLELAALRREREPLNLELAALRRERESLQQELAALRRDRDEWMDGQGRRAAQAQAELGEVQRTRDEVLPCRGQGSIRATEPLCLFPRVGGCSRCF
jgi:hypothetical protein